MGNVNSLPMHRAVGHTDSSSISMKVMTLPKSPQRSADPMSHLLGANNTTRLWVSCSDVPATGRPAFISRGRELWRSSSQPPAQGRVSYAGCSGPSPAGFWAGFIASAECWINKLVVPPQQLISAVLDIVFAAAAVKKWKRKEELRSSGNFLLSCTFISPCSITR